MKANLINEGVLDVLKPKSGDELQKADQAFMKKAYGVFELMNNNGFKVIDFSKVDNNTVVYEFDDEIGTEREIQLSMLFYDNPIKGLEDYDLDGQFLTMEFSVSPDELPESMGAGYSVYGGAAGFGNPSMRGFSGRGVGFGGSHNLTGGPNLMYTYSVKPLNQVLQQKPSPVDDDQYIHVGSKIKGYILNTNKKIEGQILHIEEDEDNNIKHYIVLDKEGRKRMVDPTTAYLIKPDELVDPTNEIKESNMKNFYPLFDINEGYVKYYMMELAHFVSDIMAERSDSEIDEMVKQHFSPEVYEFYMSNREGVFDLVINQM